MILTTLNKKRIEKWDDIYRNQKKRWNDLPSKLAETTLKYIYYNNRIKHIFDIGGGYGRDSKYFLDKGYRITNIDSSKYATNIFKNDITQRGVDVLFHNNLDIINEDALKFTNYRKRLLNCDLVFCNYFLHLLSVNELNCFLDNFLQKFKPKTYIAFNLISQKDIRYKGINYEEMEKDIFWSYWSKKDVVNLIDKFPIKMHYWEEELEIEYVNKKLDQVYSHFIIAQK